MATPSHRLVQLLLQLQSVGTLTTAQAACHLGVDRRVALSDLKRLAEVAPIHQVGRGRGTRWIYDPIDSHKLTLMDQVSLRIGRDLTGFLDGTLLAEGLQRVTCEEPDTGSARRCRHVQQKFWHKSEPARSYAALTDVVDDVLDGLVRERLLDVQYANGRRYEGVLPLTLVVYRRALYLVVRSGLRDFTLSVDRIESVSVGEPFDYPESWDPGAYLDTSFGIFASGEPEEVVLDFSATVARYVRGRRWHPTSTLTDLADGGVRLTMHTSGQELLRWVAEWREHCVVRRPAWLRERVVESLQEALAHYSEA